MDAILASPRIVYDTEKGRFIVTATITNEKTYSKIFVATSKTGSPSSGDMNSWDFVTIDAWSDEDAGWADDLGLAVDGDTVYVTAALKTTEWVNNENERSFLRSKLWTLRKQSLYAIAGGDSNVSSGDFVQVGDELLRTESVLDVLNTPQDCTHFLPATIENAGVKEDSTFGTYLVAYGSDCASEQNPFQELSLVRVSNPLDFTGPTFTQSAVDLGAIDNTSGSLPDATQLGTGYAPIEMGPRKVQDAAWYNEKLHVALTVGGANGQSNVYWVTIDTSKDNGSTLPVIDSGLIDGSGIGSDDVSTFFPSLAVSKSGDLLVGFGASSPSLYSGVYARLASQGASAVVQAGESSMESLDGVPYHGMYSGASVDPSDSSCFWIFNAYARDTSQPELLFRWARGSVATTWAKTCIANE